MTHFRTGKPILPGFKCPSCSSTMRVSQTRGTEDGRIRRRRICPSCPTRFSTVEIPEKEVLRLTSLRPTLLHYIDSITRIANHVRENVIP